jgi:hypothetical protein
MTGRDGSAVSQSETADFFSGDIYNGKKPEKRKKDEQ